MELAEKRRKFSYNAPTLYFSSFVVSKGRVIFVNETIYLISLLTRMIVKQREEGERRALLVQRG
jgi:hypothetical protein